MRTVKKTETDNMTI